MRRQILLTGGAGYIGSHTFVALHEAGFAPVILDNFTNARRDVPHRLARITGTESPCLRCDTRDIEALRRVFAEHDFAAVIHFAALKAVGESVEKPLDYIDTNCGGLINLLKVMRESGVRHLVFSSSATVYGDPETLPIPETAPTAFTNPYGYTKLMGEQTLRQLADADASWVFGVLRYFNPAGAHRSGLIGEDPQDIPNNLMPYIAGVAAGTMPKLRIFGNDYDTADGTGVRDYIHVEDLAEGHVLSLKALLDEGQGHLVNLGTGRGYSVLEMLAAYSRACGRELPYEFAARRDGDIASCYADPTRAAKLLGFRATRDLDDMCASSWNWVRQGLTARSD